MLMFFFLCLCVFVKIESNRIRSSLETTLKRHDVTIMAERRKRHVLTNLFWGDGCRCSYDPNSDGGEYRTLMELRQEQHNNKGDHDDDEEKEPPKEVMDNDRQEQNDASDDEFDYLLDDDLPDDDGLIKEAEDRRRAELEFQLIVQASAFQHGYGTHRQMHPARVLKAAGLALKATLPPHAVVLHLFDADSYASARLDLALEEMAHTYRGTKFIRADGRSTLLLDADLANHVFPRLQPDRDMPTLVAVRDGVVVATCPNLQGLAKDDYVSSGAVIDWLDKANVLVESTPGFDEVCGIRPEEEALIDNMMAAKLRQGERFNCGVPLCQKTFPHEHVGIQNEEQSGRILSEEEILGGY